MIDIPVVHHWMGTGLPTQCCGKTSAELPLDAQGTYDPLRVTCSFKSSQGCWVAFNWDGSAFVPFATELDALRHANGYGGMPVRFVRFGDEDWMRQP